MRLNKNENRVIGGCICLWNLRDYAAFKQHQGTYFQGRYRTGGVQRHGQCVGDVYTVLISAANPLCCSWSTCFLPSSLLFSPSLFFIRADRLGNRGWICLANLHAKFTRPSGSSRSQKYLALKILVTEMTLCPQWVNEVFRTKFSVNTSAFSQLFS